MLHSAVAGFVTRLECLLPCGGGHVEHILKISFKRSEQYPEDQLQGSQELSQARIPLLELELQVNKEILVILNSQTSSPLLQERDWRVERFRLETDFQRVQIWRERKTRYYS
ncbi:hypothetical protein TNCV_741481 [Trichonephila clavipes]|nr:hypothetical protein TNCV_741481 [Trichonephila clavipes]